MQTIRKKHSKSNPYTDPNFPFDHDHQNFHWVRPHQIVYRRKEPVFISGGASTFDINQGALGDCWFLAAVQVFIKNKNHANNLLCPEQNGFSDEKYCGAFVFKFWRYGKFIEVIIDDKLPCRKTPRGTFRLKNLKVGKSGDDEDEKDDVEFWPCLVEKAYAKLKGGYNNIEGGLPNEAFMDLCGATGRTESLEQDCDTSGLFSKIESHLKNGGYLTCATRGKDTQTSCYGIVGGHAYSINSAVRAFGGKALLLSIRNPWGRTEAKNLPYSDDSDVWKQYPKEKLKLQKKLTDDGEFFMEINNFVKFFSSMTISFMNGKQLCETTLKKLGQTGKIWNELHSEHTILPVGSRWGSMNLPRIPFTLPKKSKCIIAFCLKNRRRDNIRGIHTGFCVFNVSSGERVFSMSRYEGKTAYENSRSVELEAGKYEIEPKSLKALDKDYECFCRVWCLEEIRYLEERGSFSGSNDVGVEDKRAELIELHDELLVKLDDLRQKIEDF